MIIEIRDRKLDIIQQVNRFIENKDFGRHRVIANQKDFFDDDDFDVIVSPANSFGFMNGGIDGLYTAKYGQSLEYVVREKIRLSCNFRELLIGDAISVRIPADDKKWLIAAPTMRVPMPINNTPVNVYLATRAAIHEALMIGSNDYWLRMPGMGTATGMVDSETAALNMVMGIMDAIRPPEPYKTCAEAYLGHQRYYGL